MEARVRLIASVAIAIVAVLAMWILLVQPKRNEANNLSTEIASEQTALATAQQQLAAAEQARRDYPAEVRSLRTLSIAVPSSDEEPALIREINGLEVDHSVNYSSTTIGTASPATADLATLALSFDFDATYANLQSFLGQFDSLTLASGSNVRADGRLVSVGSVALTPMAGHVSATVSMTAYQTAPATAAVGATGATGATAAVAP